MKKFNLDDIKNGVLTSEKTTETLEFLLHGEKVQVEVMICSLSYEDTEQFYEAMRKGELEKVSADWISKALVNEQGERIFTATEVKKCFSVHLMNSVIERILSLNILPKEILNEDEEESEKKNEP